MKKRITIFLTIMLMAGMHGFQAARAVQPLMYPPCEPNGPVTTVESISLCLGSITADFAVTVTSFNNVGGISLKLAYEPSELGTPELLSENPALWPNFVVNTDTIGTIIVSGYGAGIDLPDNSILFTLRFTAPSGLEEGTIDFVENVQGTSCEYLQDAPPDFAPFCDDPPGSYYIPGGLTINYPQPSGPAPTVADLQATGQNIRWYDAAAGGNLLDPSTLLEDATDYWASQSVDGCESTERLKVTVTVDPTPCAPTGTPEQSFCSGDSPVIGDLVATGTGIQWYAAETGGIPLLSSVPLVTGTDYWATQTITCIESARRLKVTVTIASCP